MTPAAIIRKAKAEGVSLFLTHGGTVKASGDDSIVKRWLPSIREHKAGIVKELLERSALTGDLQAIRDWLDFIGENDPAVISEVMEKCRTDDDAKAYFEQRAKENTP